MESVQKLMSNNFLFVVGQGLRRLTMVEMELLELKEACMFVILVLLVYSSVKRPLNRMVICQGKEAPRGKETLGVVFPRERSTWGQQMDMLRRSQCQCGA